MRLSKIPLRNVRRHPSRALLLGLVIAVTVAVTATLALVNLSAEEDLARQVDEYGANIVVIPRSEELPLSYGGVDLGGLTYDVEPLHMSDLDKIRGIEVAENVNRVAPKLVDVAEIDGTRVLAAGVQWEQEFGLKRWWHIRGEKPSGPSDVLLGAEAAESLGLTPGDQVSLKGESLRVKGVLEETGTDEDGILFLDLGVAQRLWDRGDEVSFIEVSAWCNTCPIETINAQIAAEMPYARVSSVLKMAESRELLIGQFRLFSMVLSGLMAAVGVLIVLSTTLGAVRDRRREIGVFRSLGYRRYHILEIVLAENLALGGAAALIGVGVATAVQGPLARRLAGVVNPLAPPPLVLAAVLVTALFVVLLATLYPAWAASRLSPSLALREV